MPERLLVQFFGHGVVLMLFISSFTVSQNCGVSLTIFVEFCAARQSDFKERKNHLKHSNNVYSVIYRLFCCSNNYYLFMQMIEVVAYLTNN